MKSSHAWLYHLNLDGNSVSAWLWDSYIPCAALATFCMLCTFTKCQGIVLGRGHDVIVLSKSPIGLRYTKKETFIKAAMIRGKQMWKELNNRHLGI